MCYVALVVLVVPTIIVVKYLIFCFEKRKLDSDGQLLIAVGAQHPTINGEPGIEYEKRLIKAILLYRDSPRSKQPKIVVCGSAHPGDITPLWLTGQGYLKRHGIDEDDVVALKDRGYNCMDEVKMWVQAYNKAKLEGARPNMVVIGPHYKTFRNKIAFLWNMGIVPEFNSSDEHPDIRQLVEEIFLLVYTLFFDPSWQCSISPLRYWTRRTRQTENKL